MLSALRGRAVLLWFWSYDNVHCWNLLPDLTYLENRYHDGLTVIGIHTPKYPHQRDSGAVLKAVNRLHIRHPVANDPDHLLWREYGVDAWPSAVLIDAEGLISAIIPGEGRRQDLDEQHRRGARRSRRARSARIRGRGPGLATRAAAAAAVPGQAAGHRQAALRRRQRPPPRARVQPRRSHPAPVRFGRSPATGTGATRSAG